MTEKRQLRIGASAGIAVAVMVSVLGASPAPATTSADAAPSKHAPVAPADHTQSPNAIQGLKWKTERDWSRPNPDDLGVRFDTQRLPYSTAVASLRNNGFRTVALRVANDEDLPDRHPDTLARRDAEVIKMMRELNLRGVNFYLYKRQWLQRRDAPWGHYTRHPGADMFCGHMSKFINQAKREGLGRLQGIMPIETNLNNSSEALERTLYIARCINKETEGWLKEHTFMMPGAGMGGYFKNIHRRQGEWLTKVGSQTGYFAFIYKHMKSHEGGVNDLERLNERWNHYVGLRATTTVGRQIQFLREDMGLADLEWYIRHYKSHFPRHAHVVFWGDAADGVSFLSQSDDPGYNYNTMRALHNLSVKKNRWHGYFFNFPFTSEAARAHDLWKYLITVDRNSGQPRRNFAMNRSKTHTVWSEWHNWANPTFQY